MLGTGLPLLPFTLTAVSVASSTETSIVMRFLEEFMLGYLKENEIEEQLIILIY